MPSSYLILYDKGNSQVLIGTKQTISFAAVKKFLKNLEEEEYRNKLKKIVELMKKVGENPNAANSLKDEFNNILLKGEQGIGKRLDGMLSPTGGKYAFCGGKTERGEDCKIAAMRECKEELGPDIITPEELDLEEPYTIKDNGWIGIYFYAEFNLDTLYVQQRNQSVQQNYKKLLELLTPDVQFAEFDIFEDKDFKQMEMGNFVCKPINDEISFDYNINEDLLEKEIDTFSWFFLSKILCLSEHNEQEKNNMHSFLKKSLVAYIKDEKTNGNKRAFEKLKEKIAVVPTLPPTTTSPTQTHAENKKYVPPHKRLTPKII